MPIDVDTFESQGTAPVRVGFSGEKTAKIKALLTGDANSAFSLDEVATHVEVDTTDKAAMRNLVNLLYGLRKKNKAIMKVVDGTKYYAAITE